MQHVHSLAKDASGLLAGTCNVDPAQHGLTSNEEQTASGAPNVRNSRLPLGLRLKEFFLST